MIEVPKIKNGSHGPDHSSLRGGLSSVTCNGEPIPTRSGVSISTGYENMEGDRKCEKWGGLRYLEVTQGH